MKTIQTTEDFHRSAIEVLRTFLDKRKATMQKQPRIKAQIRPFQKNQKKTYPHGLLLTLNPNVFSKQLEHHDQLVPQHDDFTMPHDRTLRLPSGKLIPTATDLLRHQVPLLPRIDPRTLKQTSWKPRPFALLQRRMALGFYKILDVVRTLYLDAPNHLPEPPVIRVQTQSSPQNETRSSTPTIPNQIVEPHPNPDYSHLCIHCWSPSQSPYHHSDTESDLSDENSYLSDTDSSGTSTSELDINNIPDGFRYSPTSPTYSQNPEVALYLTV